MHLLTFTIEEKEHLGVKIGDYVFQLNRAYEHSVRQMSPRWFSDMRTFLEEGDSAIQEVRNLVGKIEKDIEAKKETILFEKGVIHWISDVDVTAPIRNPDKIVCIGQNYKDHCLEQNKPFPKNPILFSKFRTAIIGTEDKIIRPRLTEKLDFEGELAIVVGKKGKHIPEEKAFEYIAGYTIFNDISARDIQFGDRQWLRGKTFDTFAPLGPFLVTKDEITNPNNLYIKTSVNGELMQDSNTNNMIFKIPYLMHFISQVVTLLPGDIIATGTPSGVGVFRSPPVFLKASDEVIIEIDTLGRLRNSVIDEEI